MNKYLSPDYHHWVNADGDQVPNKASSDGLKIFIEITHPEWILFLGCSQNLGKKKCKCCRA